MRIFLTGATGFIGSKIVPELLGAGHEVLGVARSDAGARALAAAGAQAHRAELEDAQGLRAGAAQCEAVVHTAFDHDFSRFAQNCEKDARVIRVMGEALEGSDRPLLITSGIGFGSPAHGEVAVESVFNPDHANPRVASELAGAELVERGVNVSVMRLPQVHDEHKQGLITPILAVAREKGVCAYVGDGSARWPAAHVSDVARLYRLAIEAAEPGARYHAVDEEGVSTRDIAEALGAGLGVATVSLSPEAAAGHFGWLSAFAGMDMPASSAWTRRRLGWTPTGPGMIADLRRMDYVSA